MKLIPSDKIEIISPYSKSELEGRLKENIQPKRGIELRLSKPKNQKTFEGILTQSGFKIQRVITGKNSFLPQIEGTIQEGLNGTKIKIDLTIHRFVVVFMAIWLGLIGFFLIGTIYGIITQDTNPMLAFMPLIMIAFGIGMVHFGYGSEKKKSIDELKRILDGRISDNKYANTVYN